MADAPEHGKRPLSRAFHALVVPTWAALVGLVVAGLITGGIWATLRTHHVSMRAWVFAAIGAALLLALVLLFDMLAMKAGQLEEARRREAEARQRAEELSAQPREPTLSPRSRELIGLIEALETSIERRRPQLPYQYPDLEEDERDRFTRICLLTRVLVSHTSSVEKALTDLQANGVRDAASCLGALDELKARVTAFGERDEDEGALRTGGTRLVLED
jgi:hypothetical protein